MPLLVSGFPYEYIELTAQLSLLGSKPSAQSRLLLSKMNWFYTLFYTEEGKCCTDASFGCMATIEYRRFKLLAEIVRQCPNVNPPS